METIKLKLNLSRLKSLGSILGYLIIDPSQPREYRAQRNILAEVSKKLQKKLVDVYPKEKDFNYKLKYYEAHALELWIRSFLDASASWPEFETQILNNIADELTQKLA